MSVSQTFNLPPGLLSALCYVETNHNINAINLDDGGSPSLGICQIKYTTAKHLGYKGTPQKLWKNEKLNIYYAGKYLHRQLDRHGGNVSQAVASYNLGHFKSRKDGRAVNHKYVDKVFNKWGQYEIQIYDPR